MLVGTGQDDGRVARDHVFPPKTHDFTTANIIVKPGMLLLRTSPPLLLIPLAIKINMKSTETELTKQKLGKGEIVQPNTLHLNPVIASVAEEKEVGTEYGHCHQRYAVVPCYGVHLYYHVPGKSRALQKLLSMFASYTWSRQQLPWLKWKAEHCFPKQGGKEGVSLWRKRRWRKSYSFFMVNHFLQLQACSDPAAVLTVQVKVFVFSFKMPPPTTDD